MLPNHQPDCQYQGDSLTRALHEHEASVGVWTREVRLAIAKLREDPEDRAYRAYLSDAWKARRALQEAVKAHRLLIAQRDALNEPLRAAE